MRNGITIQVSQTHLGTKTKIDMKILVTGGAGFVGSNLIKRLREIYPKADILSVDNYFTGKISNHVNGVSYINKSVYDFLKQNIKPGTKVKLGIVNYDHSQNNLKTGYDQERIKTRYESNKLNFELFFQKENKDFEFWPNSVFIIN